MPSQNKRDVYRPCFSKSDLETITSLVSTHMSGSKLHHYLSLFLLKVNVGVNAAAFSATPKSDSLDIGLTENKEKTIKQIVAIAETAPTTLSPKERYDYLSNLWLEDKINQNSPEYQEGKELEFKMFNLNTVFM